MTIPKIQSNFKDLILFRNLTLQQSNRNTENLTGRTLLKNYLEDFEHLDLIHVNTQLKQKIVLLSILQKLKISIGKWNQHKGTNTLPEFQADSRKNYTSSCTFINKTAHKQYFMHNYKRIPDSVGVSMKLNEVIFLLLVWLISIFNLKLVSNRQFYIL